MTKENDDQYVYTKTKSIRTGASRTLHTFKKFRKNGLELKISLKNTVKISS